MAKCFLNTARRLNGQKFRPNDSRFHLYQVILSDSWLLHHKNLMSSPSSGGSSMFRNACSMSPIHMYLNERNRSRTSSMSGFMFGPVSKLSYRLEPTPRPPRSRKWPATGYGLSGLQALLSGQLTLGNRQESVGVRRLEYR